MSINVNNLEGLQEAQNGVIYEFLEKDGTTNKYVLVCQNDKRTEDNLVSILMLGTKKGYSSDSIPIKFGGIIYYAHCGMLTYCKRSYLGKKKAKVSDDTMARIKKNISVQIGIAEDDNDYKAMYEQLLNKVIKEIG